jgi:hypothetical protein
MRFAFVSLLALFAVTNAQQPTPPPTPSPGASTPRPASPPTPAPTIAAPRTTIQRPASPRTPPHGAKAPRVPTRPVGPPILFPFPPPLPPVAGGLTSPTPFRPRDFTRPPRDLYRVRPGKSLNSQPYSGAGGYGGGYVDPGYSDPGYGEPGYQSAEQLSPAAQMLVDSYIAGYRAALDSLQPPAPPAPRATGPTRMYVIPGCYAGNIAPRVERLPAGCDIKRVQILE